MGHCSGPISRQKPRLDTSIPPASHAHSLVQSRRYLAVELSDRTGQQRVAASRNSIQTDPSAAEQQAEQRPKRMLKPRRFHQQPLELRRGQPGAKAELSADEWGRCRETEAKKDTTARSQPRLELQSGLKSHIRAAGRERAWLLRPSRGCDRGQASGSIARGVSHCAGDLVSRRRSCGCPVVQEIQEIRQREWQNRIEEYVRT